MYSCLNAPLRLCSPHTNIFFIPRYKPHHPLLSPSVRTLSLRDDLRPPPRGAIRISPFITGTHLPAAYRPHKGALPLFQASRGTKSSREGNVISQRPNAHLRSLCLRTFSLGKSIGKLRVPLTGKLVNRPEQRFL